MFEICSVCGRYSDRMEPCDAGLKCPACGHVAPFVRRPVFFLSGASGVGKSTAAHVLFEKHTEYMTMECDILWGPHFNTPEDDYAAFRDTWLRLAANCAQYGKSSLLCGCITPEQVKKRWRSRYFSAAHYIAITVSDEELLRRMRRRGFEEAHMRSSMEFNRWIREHGEEHGMVVLDATCLTAEETAEKVHAWIMGLL